MVTVHTLIKILDGNLASVVMTFTFCTSYLMYGYYIIFSEEYAFAWTIPQCVLTLRLIAVSFDVYDGKKRKNRTSKKEGKEEGESFASSTRTSSRQKDISSDSSTNVNRTKNRRRTPDLNSNPTGASLPTVEADSAAAAAVDAFVMPETGNHLQNSLSSSTEAVEERMLSGELDSRCPEKELSGNREMGRNDVNSTDQSCIVSRRAAGAGRKEKDDTVAGIEDDDAFRNPESLSHVPSLVELMAHSYFPASFLVGPQYGLKVYQEFVQRRTPLLNRCTRPSIDRLVLGILYMALFQIGSNLYPHTFFITKDFRVRYIYIYVFALL